MVRLTRKSNACGTEGDKRGKRDLRGSVAVRDTRRGLSSGGSLLQFFQVSPGH